ncbi:hypothetical protein, partial [Oenococcus oeni]|uniref:hypothetical protein n=1 Tax=Oenococcus oeni TaxID=1247 RepID=UPI001C5B4EC8
MKDKRFMSDDHIEMIDEEYAKAVGKHPEWPNGAVYAAAIVMEESGELIRSAVQYNMEGGSIEAMEKEAIQTIVTSIRFLNALESYKKALNTGSGVEWSFNAYAREYGFPAVHSECVFITA